VKCGRRPIRVTRFRIANEKARGRFPGAGFCNSCDDEDMPVICPTCQTLFWKQPPISWRLLVKPLNRWRGCSGGNRFGGFCDRQRRRLGGSLLLCPGIGLYYTARARMSGTPGMCDRGASRVSDERARHRADRSQHDGAGHRAQGSTSGALLRARLERKKCRCDHRCHKQFLHHVSPA